MLRVRASGSGNITYQWMKDGEFFSEDDLANCIGATSDTLQFLSLSSEHSGTYVCRVSNENASVESKKAVLKGKCSYNIVLSRCPCSLNNNMFSTVFDTAIYFPHSDIKNKPC